MRTILILLAAICCCGCGSVELETTRTTDTPKIKFYRDDGIFIYSIEIEGHLYIVFDGHYAGSIIHAEHCPCKKK